MVQKEILATLGNNVHLLHQSPILAQIVSVVARQLLVLLYQCLALCTKMVSLQPSNRIQGQSKNNMKVKDDTVLYLILSTF